MSIEDELRQVEEDLVRLRAQNQEMRRQVREVGATDQVEVSAMISQADELMELIAGLERRRDTLRERLEKGRK
ncbi:hypothetical protein ACFOY2_38935 [Nonomuraea purpurea]|uniref:Uncharacterized protein n=1 Tax=Nonomuraea purpurea TaxID=1849276 RepID=A0ABV8GKF1_9ACTN